MCPLVMDFITVFELTKTVLNQIPNISLEESKSMFHFQEIKIPLKFILMLLTVF
jgi:hypothetical protein